MLNAFFATRPLAALGGGGAPVSLVDATSWSLDIATQRHGGNAYQSGAIYDPGTDQTVITYSVNYGTDAVRALVYDHGSQEWRGPFNVAPSYMQADGHGWPGVELLSDGRMVCFHGSHANFFEQKWAISGAGDFSTWDIQSQLGDQGYTYPKPVNKPDGAGGGDLYLFFRHTDVGYQPYKFRKATYTAGGSLTFGPITNIIEFSGHRIYASTVHWDGTHFVICWCRADSTDNYRRDVYFAKLDPATGNLLNLDESVTVLAANLPLDQTEADANFRTHVGDTFIPHCHHEPDGTIHLVYSDNAGTGGADFDLNYDVWDGSAWAGKTKLADQHNYQSSGFKGQAAQVLVTSTGAVEVYYNRGSDGQTERGADFLCRRVDSGAGFAAEEVLVTESLDYSVSFPMIVQGASDTIRCVAPETVQSGASNVGGFVPMHIIGTDVAEMPSAYAEPDFKYAVEQVDFTRFADGTTPDFLDASPSVIRFQYLGDATVSSGALVLDGSGDLAEQIDPGFDDTHISAEKRRFNIDPGQDYTIEVWFTLDSLSGDGKHIWGHMGFSGDRGSAVVLDPAGNLLFQSSPDGSTIISHSGAYSWQTGVEYYVCIARQNGTLRMFVSADGADATMIYSASHPEGLAGSSGDFPHALGGGSGRTNSRMHGKFRASRTHRGVALRSTDSDFAPPTLPLYDPAFDGYS